MSKHTTISPQEAADRLAIRELVEAYARCADRRDTKGQVSLFTEDAHFVVYMNAKDRNPVLAFGSGFICSCMAPCSSYLLSDFPPRR